MTIFAAVGLGIAVSVTVVLVIGGALCLWAMWRASR